MDQTEPRSHSPLSTPGLKTQNLLHKHTHTRMRTHKHTHADKERMNTGVCVLVSLTGQFSGQLLGCSWRSMRSLILCNYQEVINT